MLSVGIKFPQGTSAIYSKSPGGYSQSSNFYSSFLDENDTFVKFQLSRWPLIKSLIKDEIPNYKQAKPVLFDLFLHTIHMCKEEFGQIPPGYDFSVPTWLDKTSSYTSEQKQQFLQLLQDEPQLKRKHFECKCFCKAETYPEIKPLRPIKSRSDRFKIEVGPGFQAINENLFIHECFVKKIPINERPHYLRELVSFMGFEIDCTDFSKFESHFIRVIMHIIEFTFYSYTLFKTSIHDYFMQICYDVLASDKQTFVYKYFTSSFSATRASGEMCTSSGNGFSNFCLYKFVCRLKGATYAKGGFEGDDGETCTKPSQSRPTTQDYLELGWFCKLNSVKNFSEASFCGMVADEHELINVCDIYKAVAEFGWTSETYAFSSQDVHLSLLRAKGYSMVYQYSGCPILDSLGHYALRVTHTSRIEELMNLKIQNQYFMDPYKREILLQAILKGIPERKMPGPRTRELVERLYGISVSQQIRMENYLDNKNDLQPIPDWLDYPEIWRTIFISYTRNYYDSAFCIGDPINGANITLNRISSEAGVDVSGWAL